MKEQGSHTMADSELMREAVPKVNGKTPDGSDAAEIPGEERYTGGQA